MDDEIADDTPVVVGMACRFAGADGLDAYWQRLLTGRSALGTTDRWPGVTGVTGGFLEGHDQFDAQFFRISPNEAKCMDPQQRLLLQTVQHAVDDAHVIAEDLRELRCGVFAAGLPGDYRSLVAQRPEVALNSHSFLGNAPSTLSGRISYYYDIGGPSITLDSACSSSVTALHTALLNIRAGDCDAAIVGAVSVFSTPEVVSFAENSNMSSPTGRSRPFTSEADGFIPAEGVAALVIMRSDEARARGLRNYGAIVASGLNHNGLTNGLAAPSGRAQARLMGAVHRRNSVNISRIALVETHGTGTELGDPLELEGLKATFGSDLFLGAVKPVIGHTLVCSGLAGVIKVLLSFKHETIPPCVRADDDTPYLDLAPFRLNDEPVAWPVGKPLAAVSAFGFTGSNGHVVLQRPNMTESQISSSAGPHAFCLSAESETSLDELSRRLCSLVDDLPEEHLGDLSQLLLRRPRLRFARVVLSSSRSQLMTALSSGAQSDVGATSSAIVALWDQGKTAALRSDLTVPAELADIQLPAYPFRPNRHWVLDGADSEIEPPRTTRTADRLSADLNALLGHGDGPDRVSPASRISTLGLDSLSAVQLLATHQRGSDPVKAHELFGYATVHDLADAIDARSKTARPQLEWWEDGSGRTTVLLPPLNADRRAWTQQTAALVASGHRVLIPTYPGHGPVVFDTDRFTLNSIADEISDKLGEGEADVVGWSLGGCIASLVALRHPACVRSLTLISTAARYDNTLFERTVELRHELRLHEGLLQTIFEQGGDLATAFTAAASMDVLGQYFAALMAFDVVDRLRDVSVPSLIVRGGDDCVVEASSFDVLRQIPRAHPVVLEGHGHYAPLTAGAIINGALLDFWAENARKK